MYRKKHTFTEQVETARYSAVASKYSAIVTELNNGYATETVRFVLHEDRYGRMLFGGMFIGLLLLLLPPVAYAQAPTDTITGKVHELSEIEVRKNRVHTKISTTSSLQLFNKEDLQNLGFQNLADAVRRFAGTNVRDYGGIGGLKTVSVRNLGAAHTAVSYDGIAVSNCQAGQIDIGRFSLDNISTLSLAVGQEENLLQPARLYASAGVLNIETEKPTFDKGKNHHTQLLVRGGSFGYITPSIRHWQRLGGQTSLSANASYMRADGNYPYTLVNGKEQTQEKRNNSAIYSWQGEANLYHTFTDASELSGKAYYFYSKRGLPGAVILYNPIAREQLWDENFFAQAKYRKTFSQQWSLQAQGKFNYSWNKYEDTDVKYESGRQTETNRQNEYYLSATLAWQPLAGLKLSWAQDGIINTLKTNGQNGPEPVRYTALSALNIHYQVNRLKLLCNVVGTYITERVESGNSPKDRKRLSPTLSMSYQLLDNEALFVRVLYKNTFRVPTFNDLYYLRVGNTNLRPEKATEYTAGITWSGKPAAWLDFLTLTVDGYYNEVKDKIIAFPTTYVWKMQNYGKVRITGIDVTASTALPLGRKLHLSLTGNYSWQKAIDVTNSEAKNYKEQLPYTPEHNGNVSASLETPWVNIGYTLTAVGKRYYLAQNLKENEIEGYVEQTATLWRELNLKGCHLRLQAELINLADAQYEIIKYYPMPGRSWRVGATFSF